MQKIIFTTVLLGILSGHLAVAKPVDPAVASKIKLLTSQAVEQERRSQNENTRQALIIASAGQKLDSMLIRMNTIAFSLQYYNRFKKKIFDDAMLKGQDEVARACCPLNPRALKDQIWYANDKSGKRKKKREKEGVIKKKGDR